MGLGISGGLGAKPRAIGSRFLMGHCRKIDVCNNVIRKIVVVLI